MKIAVMQPYFFPYIGYFQLINYADAFVNLDHVSFMKSSYMTRNKLRNDTPINIGVLNGSQNRSCIEVYIDKNDYLLRKFRRKLEINYGNSLFYKTVLEEVILPWMEFIESEDGISISRANVFSIKLIMKYLNINTEFIDSSLGLTHNKSAQGQIDIVKHFEGDVYVNPVGGKVLYSKEFFEKSGLELRFLEMNQNAIENANLSILHHLFVCEKEHIAMTLNNFKLI